MRVWGCRLRYWHDPAQRSPTPHPTAARAPPPLSPHRFLTAPNPMAPRRALSTPQFPARLPAPRSGTCRISPQTTHTPK